MRLFNVGLWVVVVMVLANALILFWRGIDVALHFDGVFRLAWIFKMGMCVGIMALVACLFGVRTALSEKKMGEAIKRVRVLSGIALMTALLNSAANASLETQMKLGQNSNLGWPEAGRHLLMNIPGQILGESLLVYVLILLTFLLTGFIRLAIEFKSENESFI